MKNYLDLLSISEWVNKHYLQIAVFNLTIGFLILLRTAGYFHPFLILSVNLIFFCALVLAILILNARSNALFIFAIIFTLISAFFKIVNVDIWAQRSAIYVYQALFLGVVVLLIEYLRSEK